MFAHTSKLNWEGVRAAAEDFRVTIEKSTPAIYEEIVGIAEGAGLDVLDIVALNSRSEIALGLFSDGCTSLSWKKADGHGRLLAQNWDWVGTIKENLAIVSIEQDRKPKIFMVMEVRRFVPTPHLDRRARLADSPCLYRLVLSAKLASIPLESEPVSMPSVPNQSSPPSCPYTSP